jgi:hypothetical protein
LFLIAFPTYLIATFGLGLRLMSLFKYEPQSKLVHFFLAICLGYSFIGQIIYLAGLCHILYSSVIWLLFIFLIAMNGGLVLLFLKEIEWKDAFLSIRQSLLYERVFLFVSLLVLVLHMFYALSPQIHWDAMSYHYLLPDYFLKHHAVIDFPDVIFSYYPSIVEMQYLAGMALGGEQTANLIGNSHGIIIYIALYAIAILLLKNWRIGIPAGLIFLSTQGIHMHFEGGWNDLGVSMFIIGSLMLLFEYGKTRHQGVFYLSAVLMGAGLASKHYAYIPFAFIILFLVYDSLLRKFSVKTILKWCVQYILVCMTMPAIWYLRSFILTGNPVYPFSVFGLFPTYQLEPFVVTSWVNQGFSRNILSFFAYPFYLMFRSSWVPELTGKLPYLLLLMPFSLIKFRDNAVRSMWTFVFWTLVIMYFIAPFETRYMLYMVPFAAILAGMSVGIAQKKIKLGAQLVLPIIFVIFIIPFSVNQKVFEHYFKDKTRVILKQEWKDQYLFRQSTNYSMLWWMNHNLPDDALVLCLEPKLYRMQKNFVTWYGMKVKYPENAVEAWEKNYRHGNTHMYLGEGGMANAYIRWNIYHLPEDSNGFVRFRVQDVLKNLIDEPIPDKFWILRLSTLRNLERAGFKKEIVNGETWYIVKRKVISETLANQADLLLVDLFRDMINKGWIELIQNDGLNMIFKFNYDGHEVYFN